MNLRIGVCCPTYKRPFLLGRMVHCFLQQDYDNFKLFVIDDCNQYESRDYGKWEMVSLKTRFPSLGAKRQFGVDLLDSSFDAYMVADDDDVYFPGAVASVASALEQKPWAQCRLVYETAGPRTLAVTRAFGRDKRTGREVWGYGGCWAYRIGEHRAVGGYDPNPARSSNDDVDLARKMHRRYGDSADSTPAGVPWYWYNRDPGVNKVCQEGVDFWRKREAMPVERMKSPPIGWNGPNFYRHGVLLEEPRPLGWQNGSDG